MGKSLIVIFVLVAFLSGCQITNVSPSQFSDIYYYQPDGQDAYWSVTITDDNNGVISEYTYVHPVAPAKTDPDGDALVVSDPFTIAGNEVPYYAAGGPLTGNLIGFQTVNNRIHIYDFNNETLAVFLPYYSAR